MSEALILTGAAPATEQDKVISIADRIFNEITQSTTEEMMVGHGRKQTLTDQRKETVRDSFQAYLAEAGSVEELALQIDKLKNRRHEFFNPDKRVALLRYVNALNFRLAHYNREQSRLAAGLPQDSEPLPVETIEQGLVPVSTTLLERYLVPEAISGVVEDIPPQPDKAENTNPAASKKALDIINFDPVTRGHDIEGYPLVSPLDDEIFVTGDLAMSNEMRAQVETEVAGQLEWHKQDLRNWQEHLQELKKRPVVDKITGYISKLFKDDPERKRVPGYRFNKFLLELYPDSPEEWRELMGRQLSLVPTLRKKTTFSNTEIAAYTQVIQSLLTPEQVIRPTIKQPTMPFAVGTKAEAV